MGLGEGASSPARGFTAGLQLPGPFAAAAAPAAFTARGLSPLQERHVATFHAALQRDDVAGAAAQLKMAPALANAANPRTGEAPLHAAVRIKSVPLARLLVEGRADLGAVDKAGRTAEAVAAADGATGMASELRNAAQAAANP